jgi:hypothetical protein
MASPNYLLSAFKLKGNLVFVTAGVVVSGLLGSPFLLLGVGGLEAFYLVGMTSNERFRRAIRARR